MIDSQRGSAHPQLTINISYQRSMSGIIAFIIFANAPKIQKAKITKTKMPKKLCPSAYCIFVEHGKIANTMMAKPVKSLE